MSKYRFSLEFYPEGQTNGLSLALAKPDFQPAVEYAQFEALKSIYGQFPTAGSAMIEPTYENGGPEMAGLRMAIPISNAGVFHADLPLGYFGSVALRYRDALVKVGKMDEADEWQWAMSAWSCEDGTECRAPAVELNPKIVPGSLQEFLSRSELAGEPAVPGLFKVFIPRDVLEEAAQLALAASPMECGGVLLGNLYRDHPGSGELFLAITAHVPAVRAAGSEVELRFTPEAWHAVRTAVTLRARDEMWCGWFHSHTPVGWADKCGQCPIEKQRQCPLATRLFSDPDRMLHRAVFARAFAIGLVANVLTGGEVVHACFGWHEGRICARSYYVESRE